MQLKNTDDLTIKDLIESGYKERIWLPEFQRPFVWDRNQVRLLVDSLYRNYTISSILTWKGGDELARRRVGGSIKEINIPTGAKDKEIIYLLDGQQRTTALLLSFTDKPVYKWSNVKKTEKVNIWWDSEYEGDEAEMRWIFSDEKIIDPNDSENTIALKDFSEEEVFLTHGHRFVKLKHVIEFDDEQAEKWFEEDEVKGLRFINQYNKKLNTLKTKILSRKVYHIEQPGTLEEVLEVFERINTRNTKLSIFDIMVAKTYRKFDKGFFDLRSYYKLVNFDKSIKADYFENINNIDLDKVSYILPESDLLGLTSIMLSKKFKSKDVLKLTTKELMENTKWLHDKFQYLVGFLNQHFNIKPQELRRYNPAMKLLASVITSYDSIDYPKQEFLKTWFWNTILKNRYPGSQNERIERDYKVITGDYTHEGALKKMLADNTRNFDYLANNPIDNPRYIDAHYTAKGQQIYRAMLLLLKSKSAKDFYNGLEPIKTGASSYLLEEHHIFPKNSKLGKEISKKYSNHRYNEIINNIANIALLTKETNNKRIRAKQPSIYIAEFEKAYIDAGKHNDFIQIMESQFISPDMIELLKKDAFEEFVFQRTQKMYEQIELLCKVQ